jgi:hypothetical protein
MKLQNLNAPVILLLNKIGDDNGFVKTWFEKSRFRAVEVADMFDLLDKLSDFTVRNRPDVFIVEAVSFLSDFSLIKDMIHTSTGEAGMPVFILSDIEDFFDREEYFKGNLAQISDELDKLIPQRDTQHHFAA